MKYVFLSIFLTLFCSASSLAHAAVTPDAPTNFITTWNTENPGTSASNQITIPGTGAGYNYELYWVNTASSTISGTTSLITTSSYTLTFPQPGIYEVQASGTFPRIYFNNGGDRRKILTVEQWGNIAWTSMENAFYSADNLQIPATDAPDLSRVTSMKLMFGATDNFNSPVDHWDVSNVTDFSFLFDYTGLFNQPLNNWNTASATNMSYMFRAAAAFNQPLDNWDTSNVTNMIWMFYGRSGIRVPFNQDISNWNVARVQDMTLMFRNSDFNQPLNSWDVSSVRSFAEMFSQNSPFNQPLNNWNTASATNMLWLFSGNKVFNQDISNWNTSNVSNMSGMFSSATSFDQDLSDWDISSLTHTGVYPYATAVQNMFQGTSLSQPNQDALFTSWSTQASALNKLNFPFHIGLKSYSQTGATAIATLESLGWTITEQYQATYDPGPDATLTGTSTQRFITSGSSTTAVMITPDSNCTFNQWSDSSTTNPRVDTLTDNLTVTASVSCRGESTGTRTDRFLKSTSNASSTNQVSLPDMRTLPALVTSILASNPSPQTQQTLITVLMKMVDVLRLLMTATKVSQ